MYGWANKITAVELHWDLGTSPAAVNPRTGVFYVNPYMWGSLTSDEKDQIVAHEMGHIMARTTDEIKADAYAHKVYTSGKKGKKRSLKSTVFLLQKILTPGDPRIEAQLKRAKKTDRK